MTRPAHRRCIRVCPGDEPCAQNAAERLAALLRIPLEPAGKHPQAGDFALRVAAREPPADDPSNAISAEAYEIRCDPAGVSEIVGASGRALLHAVSDIAHHHRDSLDRAFAVRSSPALRTRGLWSWTRGLYDVEAYIERMSWWKLNTLVLWNDTPPREARDWQRLCDRCGIDLYWGFSWGWDYPDCTPEEAGRLRHLLDTFPNNGVLPCPSRSESRGFVRDYVLRHFEQHYAPIGAKAIYCQTFTERPPCPCADCRRSTTGQLMLKWVQPIIETLLDRYPHLRIACGVHNTMEDFDRLSNLDPRCWIHWERETLPNKAFPATSIKNARRLVRLRGHNERSALLIRLYGDYGLTLRGVDDPDLHGSIDRNWRVLETGEGRIERAQVHNIGYHCENGAWLANAQTRQLRDWIAAGCATETASDGVIGLLEGSLWSIRPRALPALFAEIAWNADRTDDEVEPILQRAAHRSVC